MNSEDSAVRRQVEIINALGLHLRPAAKFVKTADRFQAEIRVHFKGQVFDGRSILALASLAAGQYAQGMLWAAQLAAPILLGADPAKLAPIRPRVFELQVNVASAAAAGLTIPPDILAKASRVHGR